MSEEIDLCTHRALVTSAGHGLGRRIALGLGAAGAEVVVNDSVSERAETVAKEVRATWPPWSPISSALSSHGLQDRPFRSMAATPVAL